MVYKKYLRLFFLIVFLITFGGLLNTMMSNSIFVSSSVLEPKKSPNQEGLSSFGLLSNTSSFFSGLSKSSDVILALELLESKDFFMTLIEDEFFLEKLNYPIKTNFLRSYRSEPSDEMLMLDNMHSRFINEHLSFNQNEKTGIVTIRINHYEAEVAKVWLNLVINELNNLIKDIRVSESKRILESLKKEFASQIILEVRESLSNLMAQEIKTISFSGEGNEFVFQVIDSPRVPDKRIRPSRTLNVLAWFIFSIVFSSFVIVFFERINFYRKWM